MAQPAIGDVKQLLTGLTGVELYTDSETRRRYSRDSSIFALEPEAVAVAEAASGLGELVQRCASAGVAITPRSGGSSVAGQCLGAGVVLDTGGLCDFSLEGNLVTCGVGLTLDQLNAKLAEHGRCIGPDVTSSAWAKIGGLVSTNACGSRSLKYGRFGDVLAGATGFFTDGERFNVGRGELPATIGDRLASLSGRLGQALEGWPNQHRSYGGYRLDRFKEEGDLLSLIPGSEGTLVLLTAVTLRTEPLPAQSYITASEYGSVAEALRGSRRLSGSALSVELLDRHLVEAAVEAGLYETGREGVGALLLCEYGEPEGEAGVDDGQQDRLRQLRREALALAASRYGGAAGLFEDPAVRPELLPGFIAALQGLLAELGLEPLLYGHAAAGCIHVRPLCNIEDPAVLPRLEDALPAVADLVKEFGGALTGEHGWGLSRSYLAPTVLGPELRDCFRQVKEAFDPQGIMNPGKIVGGRNPFSYIRGSLL